MISIEVAGNDKENCGENVRNTFSNLTLTRNRLASSHHAEREGVNTHCMTVIVRRDVSDQYLVSKPVKTAMGPIALKNFQTIPKFVVTKLRKK